jgi:hypothetical protein
MNRYREGNNAQWENKKRPNHEPYGLIMKHQQKGDQIDFGEWRDIIQQNSDLESE